MRMRQSDKKTRSEYEFSFKLYFVAWKNYDVHTNLDWKQSLKNSQSRHFNNLH